MPSDTTTKFNIVIPATADRPRIELKDMTKAQAEKVLDFLDRLDRDPRLAAALDQMADRGVTLQINFADQLPSWANPSARASVQFTPLLEADCQTEGFMPNSTVTITIDRDMISNSSWESSLEGILAHEFTHFIRDSNGRFLDDLYHGGTPGNSVQDFDDGVYNGLYGTAVGGSYIESYDIVYPQLSYGQTVTVSGTSGNNLIRFQSDMSNSTVHTGAGNDFIFTMDGDDWIHADINGVKAIYDKGAGLDVVDVFLGYFEIKLTMINADLYITSVYSACSPVEDPNAIILLDHSFNDGQSIEYIRTAGGWLVELSTIDSGQTAAEPGVATSDQSAAFAPTPSGLPDSLAASYAAGTVLGLAVSGTESIPEHLRHLVGGTSTMTSFQLVALRPPLLDKLSDSVFAAAEPDGYANTDMLHQVPFVSDHLDVPIAFG